MSSLEEVGGGERELEEMRGYNDYKKRSPGHIWGNKHRVYIYIPFLS